MGRMSQDEISVGLFDECKRLQQENAALETRLTESEKAREEAEEKYNFAFVDADKYDSQQGHIDRLESALAALQEENVRLRDALDPIRPYFKSGNAITVERATIPGSLWAKIEKALSTTPETAKVQAVIEAAKEQEFLSSVPGGNVPSYTNACDKTNKAVRALNE